jgi:predicted acetyltransferase
MRGILGIAGMMRQDFQFLDLGPMVDGELELVTPDHCWINEMLEACHHPLTQREMPQQARTTREQVEHFLRTSPKGRTSGDVRSDNAPGYVFWMRMRPPAVNAIADDKAKSAATVGLTLGIVGSIGLRLGYGKNLEMYLGHIGYHVFPPARGRHFAERSCRLLFPLAKAHGFKTLWITCNPDNMASRRTIERLGAVLVETVPVPKENALYLQGDREKCRYRMDI